MSRYGPSDSVRKLIGGLIGPTATVELMSLLAA